MHNAQIRTNAMEYASRLERADNMHAGFKGNAFALELMKSAADFIMLFEYLNGISFLTQDSAAK